MLSNKALTFVFLALAGLGEAAPTAPKVPGGRFLANSNGNSKRQQISLTPEQIQAIISNNQSPPLPVDKRQGFPSPDDIAHVEAGIPPILGSHKKRQADSLTPDEIGQIIADSQLAGYHDPNYDQKRDVEPLTPDQISQIVGEEHGVPAVAPDVSKRQDDKPLIIVPPGPSFPHPPLPPGSPQRRQDDNFLLLPPPGPSIPHAPLPPGSPQRREDSSKRDDFEITDPEDGGFPVPDYPPRARRSWKVYQS